MFSVETSEVIGRVLGAGSRVFVLTRVVLFLLRIVFKVEPRLAAWQTFFIVLVIDLLLSVYTFSSDINFAIGRMIVFELPWLIAWLIVDLWWIRRKERQAGPATARASSRSEPTV